MRLTMSNKKRSPSLYRNSTSSNTGKTPSIIHDKKGYDKKNFQIPALPQFNINSLQSPAYMMLILIVLIIIVIATVSVLNGNFGVTTEENNTTETVEIEPTTTLIGNNSLGSVSKTGPYGNPNSNVKIAYILGVHPREEGAHRLMEQALLSKENNLTYCYYIYKVNVTENPDDFSQSRNNGEKLANEYAVPDIINESFDATIDCHYSDGSWNVERFVFTSVENNTMSYELSNGLAENFEWLEYYNPGSDASSPDFVMTPLNQKGIASILYEAYTKDNETVTLEHDKEFISFIDQWNFNK